MKADRTSAGKAGHAIVAIPHDGEGEPVLTVPRKRGGNLELRSRIVFVFCPLVVTNLQQIRIPLFFRVVVVRPAVTTSSLTR